MSHLPLTTNDGDEGEASGEAGAQEVAAGVELMLVCTCRLMSLCWVWMQGKT